MKWLYIFCAFAVSTLSVQAQVYHNEWIDYDNPHPYFKITIAEDAIYRVDFNTLRNSIADAGESINNLDPRDLQLYSRGRKVPFYVHGEIDGILNQGDFIEFYGKKNDGELDRELYDKITDQANLRYSNFSDTIAYFLTWQDGSRGTNNHFEAVQNNTTGASNPEPFFVQTLYVDYHEDWYAGDVQYDQNNAGIGGFYSSIFDTYEGFGSNRATAHTLNLTLPEVYKLSSTLNATMTLRMSTIGAGTHSFGITVNNDTRLQESLAAESVHQLNFDYPLAAIKLGDNKFSFASDKQIALNHLTIRYPRTFTFQGESTVQFGLSGIPGQRKYLELKNFGHNNVQPVLYDYTNLKRYQAVLDGSLTKFNVNMMGADSIDLFIGSVHSSNVRFVDRLVERRFVNFENPTNQGDFVIITHPFYYFDENANNWIEAYRNHRRSLAGGSYNATIVEVSELYDQFAWGVPKHVKGVQGFTRYGNANWGIDHVFLIGRAYAYHSGQGRSTNNRVPSYGSPPADIHFFTDGINVAPTTSFGRLAAFNAREVGIYYEKVVEQETRIFNASNRIEDHEWRKNIVHFGGGDNFNLQERLKSFLQTYERHLEDTCYGGDVTSFFKSTPEAVEYIQSDYFDSLITHGVSLLTFLGHTAPGVFDVDLGSPSEYDNFGRHPAMVSLGCSNAHLHGDRNVNSVSDQYMYEPKKGAILFLGSSTTATDIGLHLMANELYQQVSKRNFGATMGEHFSNTFSYLWDTLQYRRPIDRYHMEQMTFHGDPAIRIGPMNEVDLVVEESSIRFNPSIVTANMETFEVIVEVSNIGKAIADSQTLILTRTLANGTIETQQRTVRVTNSEEELSFVFELDALTGVNQNTFHVELDVLDEIDEASELNNEASTILFIESEDAAPVYPYEFGIVSTEQVSLHASSFTAVSDETAYTIEIDTTETFSSVFKQSHNVVQSGGVISWDNVPVNWEDKEVYYWRIKANSSNNWFNSSFMYADDIEDGWNQSHYYQFLKDDLNRNIILDENRQFQFSNEVKDVQIRNGFSISGHAVTFFINGIKKYSNSCYQNTVEQLIIGVIDSVDGDAWHHQEHGEYGQGKCSWPTRTSAFAFYVNTEENRRKIVNFINDVPRGNHLVIYTYNDPDTRDWSRADGELYPLLQELGWNALDELESIEPRAFVLFGQKGYPNDGQVVLANAPNAIIDTSFQIMNAWTDGEVRSTEIGPSRDWNKLEWLSPELHELADKNDDVYLDIWGVRKDRTKSLLLPNVKAIEQDLQSISADIYPYLELRFHASDKLERTAPQLDFWRVYYTSLPDAAINPKKGFSFSNDTINQGEEVTFSIAVENITQRDMDSLLVQIELLDHTNTKTQLQKKYYEPLVAQGVIQLSVDLNTLTLQGQNALLLEVNPDEDQLEKTRFNNYATIPFFVRKDEENPVLDVTFDGVHIMDGEIVSAEPQILIRLKDENQHLALDDTALLSITIEDPSGVEQTLQFTDPNLTFIPAQTDKLKQKNMAEIYYTPQLLEDGVYQLAVNGEDKSGNRSGNIAYKTSFEVINEAMISNVVNYPNPFSTSTKFVYTITGKDIPDDLKIQILTVSGRVVRELTMADLGLDMHVGTNISTYAWDGTDEFGSLLANGVYLYRVVAIKNGVPMKSYENASLDGFFERGIGKLYIAR